MYTHTSLLQLRQKIRSLLGGDGIFWPDSEIDLSIKEALLTFGAISNFWQEEIFINTQFGKRIYNLFSDNTNQNSIAPSISFQTVIDWLNMDLIENISELNPNSSLFSLDDWLKKIRSVYDQFQRQTNLVLSFVEQGIGGGISIAQIADEVLDIIRISFVYTDDGNNEVEVILLRTDEKELAYFDEDVLNDESIPIYYTSTFGDYNKINLYPTPAVNGTLRLITVNGIAANLEIASDVIIPLPNNLVPYLKYGVEREIFNKDGLLKDSGRYDYCNKRWQEGIMIGVNYNSILVPKVNEVQINSESIHQMDLYSEGAEFSFPVSAIGLAGFNMFETDIKPDHRQNTISLLCTQNAKLPDDDVDKIQLDKTYVSYLAEYCLHLLQLKTGVFDLATTNDGYENFVKVALNHNQRLQKRGITFESLVESSKQEEKAEPKLVTTNG